MPYGAALQVRLDASDRSAGQGRPKPACLYV